MVRHFDNQLLYFKMVLLTDKWMKEDKSSFIHLTCYFSPVLFAHGNVLKTGKKAFVMSSHFLKKLLDKE